MNHTRKQVFVLLQFLWIIYCRGFKKGPIYHLLNGLYRRKFWSLCLFIWLKFFFFFYLISIFLCVFYNQYPAVWVDSLSLSTNERRRKDIKQTGLARATKHNHFFQSRSLYHTRCCFHTQVNLRPIYIFLGGKKRIP